MNAYVRYAYGVFGPLVERRRKQTLALQLKLLQAHLPMRAAAYLSALYLTALLASAPAMLFGVLLALIVPNTSALLFLVLPLAFGAFAAGMTIALGPLWLENTIRERAKDIDENLPHALAYLLALANAGLPPKELWRSLAEARVFGVAALEAERIARDIELFGYDIVKALRAAQERTASPRFHEFLQGAISAFQSGVELPDYLRAKTAQAQHAEEERQLKDMDTMGVMAETFLVMVVAAPLFIIIMLTVMAVNQGANILLWGFLLSLVFIPITQLIIGTLVKSLNPKVWT